MTVYYAIGGGLGHRTRALRVLDTLGETDAEIISREDVPSALEGDPRAHRDWLVSQFRGRRVIVDAFPAGLQGELSGIPGVTFDYVARLLRWDRYLRAVPQQGPRFGTTFVVETLTAEHEAFVRELSDRVVSLTLPAPAALPSSHRGEHEYSILVHSGPAEEVLDLVAYAREVCYEQVWVATRCDVGLPPGFSRLDTDRPFDYFEGAKRIISAAGFNVMLETEAWRDKHHVLPQPRRFDDQYLRAARRRAARLAGHGPSGSLYERTAPAASSSAQRA